MEAKFCKQCHQPLTEAAPQGLCPQCLAKIGLGSEPAPPGGRTPPNPADLAQQFPQLEILELLGMGGMGVVYKARQPKLDRVVALKILPVDSGHDPSFAERFEREAKALARLNHPGIVAVYDYGQTKDYYYFVMEYVEGMNLRQLLRTQTVTPANTLALVTQICAALQYAHDEHVVHRDIKPENILINKRGQVKIADFGLAKLLGVAPEANLTATQTVIGTTNYMAPEQREQPLEVDHRADIYSLGVVFYEMLTGEVPMGFFDPPSKKVQVDVRLDEVVLHALEREPDRRYQKASEIKSGVENIAATMQPPGDRERQPAMGRLAILAVAVVAVVAILAILIAVNHHGNATTAPQTSLADHQPANVATAPQAGPANHQPSPPGPRTEPAVPTRIKLEFIRADSEETSAQSGYGENAVDGNPGTYWHTKWGDDSPGLPHEIVIELHPPSVIKGFTYLPRQDESDHGMIRDFEFYVSNDGQNFGAPVKKGSFKLGKDEKVETFAPVKCRFIKLKALSEVNGLPWTSAAEIGVVPADQK